MTNFHGIHPQEIFYIPRSLCPLQMPALLMSLEPFTEPKLLWKNTELSRHVRAVPAQGHADFHVVPTSVHVPPKERPAPTPVSLLGSAAPPAAHAKAHTRSGLSLGQTSSRELSAAMGMFSVYVTRGGDHWPHVAAEPMPCGQ